MRSPRPRLPLSLSLAAALAALPVPARAFCGFFVSGADARLANNASQVVLLRKGNRTVMTMSNNYKGPPQDFAMVVPVPVVLKKRQVRTLKPSVFQHVDQLSAPRLVEYWEQDPCNPQEYYGGAVKSKPAAAKGAAADGPRSDERLGVKVEAQFTRGEYEIVVLSAQESTGLETWLRQYNYKIPAGAAEALAPYVRDQMKFFVAKVDIQKVKRDANGAVMLSPLQFSYPSNELRLPVRLGLLNAPAPDEGGGAQDLLIYVLHPEHRYEVANYPNVFIPSNVEVADPVRQDFPAFYAAFFDETVRRQQGRAVVTEYAWDTSSCDPCPIPPLEEGDLKTLGAGDEDAGNTWVLTRLHTRYDQKTLSEDLVFRKARPVVGGRANWDGTQADKVGVVRRDEVNNFQGRFIIRHYWQGKLACKHPRYGAWGGPPSRRSDRPHKPQAATNLAHAARGQVDLGKTVVSPLPPLGLAGIERTLRPGEKRR